MALKGRMDALGRSRAIPLVIPCRLILPLSVGGLRLDRYPSSRFLND